jgi:hypothetical protein
LAQIEKHKLQIDEAHSQNVHFGFEHADICREKHALRQQANEIEYLIRLLTQEITFHERARFKVQAVNKKEQEIQQNREKEEAKAIRAVSDDINLQVASIENQIKIL